MHVVLHCEEHGTGTAQLLPVKPVPVQLHTFGDTQIPLFLQWQTAAMAEDDVPRSHTEQTLGAVRALVSRVRAVTCMRSRRARPAVLALV